MWNEDERSNRKWTPSTQGNFLHTMMPFILRGGNRARKDTVETGIVLYEREQVEKL